MDGMGAASEAVVSEALILDNYLLPAYWRALTFNHRAPGHRFQ
jgi:hypothetical protein